MFGRSLFWSSEAEPTTPSAPGAAFPYWPNLEVLAAELSPCGADGTCYFTRDPRARRREVYGGYEISKPPPGHPDDRALQPLFASWARALAQMPRLREATLFWDLKLGWPGEIETVRDRMFPGRGLMVLSVDAEDRMTKE